MEIGHLYDLSYVAARRTFDIHLQITQAGLYEMLAKNLGSARNTWCGVQISVAYKMLTHWSHERRLSGEGAILSPHGAG